MVGSIESRFPDETQLPQTDTGLSFENYLSGDGISKMFYPP